MSKTNKIKKLLEYLVAESSIDFARENLPEDIWTFNKKGYILKPEVKNMIVKALSEYPEYDLFELSDSINFVGSSLTNLYSNDSDIDIHIVLNKEKFPDEDLATLRRSIMRYYKINRDAKNWYIDEHPLEVYLQENPMADMTADAIYDIKNDTWIKKPKLEDTSYNPYDIFKEIHSRVKELLQDTDLTIGELRRDTLDYKYIREMLSQLPKKLQLKLRMFLKEKSKEIKKDIESLSQDKESWKAMRRQYSTIPTSLDDIENLKLSKNWQDSNAVYKFVYSRYLYGKLISDLESLIEGKELKPEDIREVEKILNNFNSI